MKLFQKVLRKIKNSWNQLMVTEDQPLDPALIQREKQLQSAREVSRELRRFTA